MKTPIKPNWMTDPQGLHCAAAERTQTCVILAGGPSLRTEPIPAPDICKNFITINDSWRLLPSGTKAVNYFCDHAWWSMQLQKNPRSLDGHRSFHDMIYSGNWITTSTDPSFIDHPQVNVLKLTGQRGLELDPCGLRHGSNSGYQAINLAVHLGAKRIILLGYDMKVDGHRTNWHNEPRPQANTYADVIKVSMLPHFPSLIAPLKELGIEIINATPNSGLTCFPMMSLDDALNIPTEEQRHAIGGFYCQNCSRVLCLKQGVICDDCKALLWKKQQLKVKEMEKEDSFKHAIPTNEHINDYRKRYGLEAYPTKPELKDEGPVPVWEGEMEDWRS